ncbi:MAG: universal stress protein [Fimbriimonas sp.]
MKVLVGIDHSPSSKAALELVLRLKFEDLQLVLVHAVESSLPGEPSIDGFGHAGPDLAVHSRKTGPVLLREAQDRALLYGVEAHSQICLGDPAEALMAVAAEREVDLVAVGRNRRTVWDEALWGSTAKRLLRECPRHLLVVDEPPTSSDGLRVLLAVDQRFDTNAYIDAFIELKPTGISSIEVLTVNSSSDADARELVHGLPVTTEVAEGWISAGLREKNVAYAGRLAALGVPCEPRVAYGGDAPDVTLADISERGGSDLIVVGAHRHGWIDRHLHRSVSEALLAAGPSALMVLRQPEER